MANQDKQLRTTFGKLEGSSERVVLPSTLGYRERAVLHKQYGFEYGKIYNNSQSMSVYERLTSDAVVRQSLKAMHTPGSSSKSADVQLYSPSSNKSSSPSTPKTGSRPPSGFISNNNTPELTRSMREIAASVNAQQDIPLESMHPITLKSQYKHFPIDVMVQARPQTQTTNQTLRMLGTYSSDAVVAKALNAHIPAGVVKPGFHPDVKS